MEAKANVWIKWEGKKFPNYLWNEGETIARERGESSLVATPYLVCRNPVLGEAEAASGTGGMAQGSNLGPW